MQKIIMNLSQIGNKNFMDINTKAQKKPEIYITNYKIQLFSP